MTRVIAIIPAVVVILLNGEQDINSLLVLSQVILSLQLGFAVIPLIHFVSDHSKMGSFAIKPVFKIISWSIAAVLIYLNVRMVYEQADTYFKDHASFIGKAAVIMGGISFFSLLLMTIVFPLLNKKPRNVSLEVHKELIPDLSSTIDSILLPAYNRIAVALDFSRSDFQLIANAIRQANQGTEIILIHIVESVSARMLGNEADDFESRKDQEKLDGYVMYLRNKGFKADSMLGFRNRNKEIPRLVKEVKAELLVIGSHGHKGVKDWLYGETINTVRHQIRIPVLVVSL